MLSDLPHDKLVYLASPYSHPDPAVREWRYQQAIRATAYLIRRGLVPFSPIVHSHPMACLGGDLAGDWSFWRRQDEMFMDACGAIVVLMLPGWRESAGVKAEIEYMGNKRRQIEYLDPADIPEEIGVCSEPRSAVTMEFGLAAGKPRPGGASVDILAACALILRRKHGARGIDQKQFNGLIARVADMESYWLSLPSEHNWRVKEIKP